MVGLPNHVLLGSEKSSTYRIDLTGAYELLEKLRHAVKARPCLGRPHSKHTQENNMDVEPPDNLCESCGRPTPRLVFEEVEKLLLCGRCLERRYPQEGRSLLRKVGTV